MGPDRRSDLADGPARPDSGFRFSNMAEIAPDLPGAYDLDATKALFFGPPEAVEAAPALVGAPARAQWVHRTSDAALFWTRRALDGEPFALPDPTRPGALARVLESRLPADGSGLPYEQTPIFYRLELGDGSPAWACCYWPTGRITQLIAPDHGWCGFYGGLGAARAVVSVWEDVRHAPPPPRPGRTFGFVELLNNFGHQALNSLSGLERLAGSGLPAIVSGQPDFLDLPSVLPDLFARCLRMPDRWGVAARVQPGDILLNAGQQEPSQAVLDRIERLALSRNASADPRPRLAVTLREASRRCVNLVEVVAQAVEALRRDIPDLAVVTDGWVRPEVGDEEPAVGPAVAQELRAAETLARALPDGAYLGGVIGRSFLDSVAGLSGARVALAHVGTLQHKYKLFTRARTVVHGPASQLDLPTPASFVGAGRPVPDFLDPAMVADLSAGDPYADYEITDVGAVIDKLRSACGLAG